jgi:SAM-dependent methyltransferase
MPEWFEEWFTEEYLHLYPHRDEAEAQRLITLLRGAIPWQPGWRVLDVACGAGRHMNALARDGARVFGLDLSPGLLRRAQSLGHENLLRADMRSFPVRPASMDLTVNLFTSFGYFATDEEHATALTQMVASVRPGGWFAMDFLDAGYVRGTLVPEATMVMGGAAVRVTRKITEDGRFVTKHIRTTDGREYMERVRLFSPAELEQMLTTGPLEITHRFGDYGGAPLGQGSRAILIGRHA